MNKSCQEEMASTPYQIFFDAEKEMDLFSMQYQGVYFWQLVRFNLLKGITVRNIGITSKNNRNLIKEFWGALEASGEMKKKLNKMQGADILRIRPCVNVSANGSPDDHQYDYLNLAPSIGTMDLYALGDYEYIPSAVEYSMAPAEFRLILWKIWRKIGNVKDINNENTKLLSAFLKRINNEYGTSFELPALISQIQYSVACHIRYEKYYKSIYRQTCPRVIMVYPHYDDHMFAALAAAKKMNIRSIEIQHGRINAHEAYWYEDQSPLGKILPDFFLTYGEWWNRQIKLPEFCKTIAIGNVYLDTQVKKYHLVSRHNKTLCVFSNPQNGRELSEFIIQMCDSLRDRDYQILYKLHPNEHKIWKAEYPGLLSQGYITIIDDNTSVYEILAKSDIVFGISSTTFFEATVYKNLQIIIYRSGDYSPMLPLLNCGIAKGVSTGEEFLKALDGIRDTKNNSANEMEFFCSDASQHAADTITEIVMN